MHARVVIYFAYGAITLWGAASQQLPLYRRLVTLFVPKYGARTLQPSFPKKGVWALPVSLAATRGITRAAFCSHEQIMRTECNSYCSLFLRVLRCFTSPGSLSQTLRREYPPKGGWVSPFGHLRIAGYTPPPRSFSQVDHVLHRRPRPRHPPCTLHVSRTET